MLWSDMFNLTLPVLEKILRPVLVYFFLLAGLRLSGKRELAQLNAMDLVVLLTISNTVQNAIIGDDNSVTGGLVGAATLFVLNYAVVRFLFGHPKFDRLVEGSPSVLMADGHIHRSVMQKELITKSELEIAAHKQGFASLSQIDRCVLEPSGVISFMGKDPPPAEVRHKELSSRLDQISQQLSAVQASLAARG